MEGEISVLQVEKKIRSAREAPDGEDPARILPNEQMKAIQRELGDQDDQKRRAGRAGEAHQEDAAVQGSPRPRPRAS
jgi:ATP-dependent Lon protease